MGESVLLASLQAEGLNLAKGLELYDGSEPIYLEVLRAFYIQGPRQMAAMRAALNAWDLPRYGLEAHALKSAARGLGALTLGTLAAKQEKAGKKGDEEAVRQGAEELLRHYLELLEAIDTSGLAKLKESPANLAPLEPEALRERLCFAAEHAGNYDLPVVEETLRELLRHVMEPPLRDRLHAVLELCEQFLYDETEAALKDLIG